MGTSIGTVSGKAVNFELPDPASIDIADIACSLSHVCRFAGQIERHYSVAQHSVMVARKVLQETDDFRKALQGLLHDASEAYTGDIPTPLKRLVGRPITDIEDRLQSMVYELHGLPTQMFSEVHEADRRAVVTERDQFQPRHMEWVGYEDVEPYPEPIDVLPEEFARIEFLLLYQLLTEKVCPQQF